MNGPTEAAIVCVHCGREIECCAFCEAEHSDDCVCYRCLIFDIGQAYSYLDDD